MSFDPYHELLAIPPHEQPANLYRLLGLTALEPLAKVITTAADRQIAFLQSHLSGPNSDSARQLIQEVLAARDCLLDPPRKFQYDEQLRATMGLVGVPQTDSTTTASETRPAVEIQAAAPPRARVRQEPNALVEIIKIVAGGIAGLAIAALLLWLGAGLDPLGIFTSNRPPSTGKGRIP